MEFMTLRPLVAPKRSEGATAQGYWVINSVDPCVLKSNYYIHIRLSCVNVVSYS